MMSPYEIKKEICEIGRRIYMNGFVAANDGNISVSLASNQPTSGRDADLNLIGAFHSISRFLRNTSISFCRLCRTYARIGAFVR